MIGSIPGKDGAHAVRHTEKYCEKIYSSLRFAYSSLQKMQQKQAKTSTSAAFLLKKH
jgi:hypothetical protein